MLGLAVFASQFPSFLFSPLSGVVADRYNRYRLTLITQSTLLVQAGLLTAMVLFTRYTVWGIFILSILEGIINALSFLFVIIVLAFIKVSPNIPQVRSRNALVEIKEGFNYVINTPSLRTTILLLGCVSLLVLP